LGVGSLPGPGKGGPKGEIISKSVGGLEGVGIRPVTEEQRETQNHSREQTKRGDARPLELPQLGRKKGKPRQKVKENARGKATPHLGVRT